MSLPRRVPRVQTSCPSPTRVRRPRRSPRLTRGALSGGRRTWQGHARLLGAAAQTTLCRSHGAKRRLPAPQAHLGRRTQTSASGECAKAQAQVQTTRCNGINGCWGIVLPQMGRMPTRRGGHTAGLGPARCATDLGYIRPHGGCCCAYSECLQPTGA